MAPRAGDVVSDDLLFDKTPIQWQRGKIKYCSRAMCHVCGEKPMAVVSVGTGAPSACSRCLRDGIATIEEAAERFGLTRTGIPSYDAPPVQDIWFVRAGTDYRLGSARVVVDVGFEEIEIYDPILFADSLPDEDVELVVETWRGAWTERDMGGVHHVRKANPPEFLGLVRRRLAYPDDAPGGVARTRAVQVDVVLAQPTLTAPAAVVV